MNATATRITVQSATRDVARLARKHLKLPTGTRVHTDSKRVVGTDMTVRMGTTITFPTLDRERTRALADAITTLPGYHSMCWNQISISFLRDVDA